MNITSNFRSPLAYRLFPLLLLLSLAAVQAEIPTVPVSALVADSRHEQETELVLDILSNHHYRKRTLDDRLSSEILDNYLERLDPQRSFFTQADIDEFGAYRHALDEALEAADLQAAYAIFRRYRQGIERRVEYAIGLLDKKFDFSIDEEFAFDRREAPWAKDESELNELWRKRVKNDYLNLKLAEKDEAEIKDTLMKRYRRLRTTTQQLNADDVFQSFINAYTAAIEPHTNYFSPRTSENFDIGMRLSLEGIGAVLRGNSDYTQVQKVVPGGPAELGGELHREDKIIGVGQDEDGPIVDVIGWRLDDVVDLIRGPKGSVVRLEILPKGIGAEGPGKIIAITRDKIKLEEQAAKSEIIEVGQSGRIGVIDVPTFYSDFAAQARGEKDYKSTSRDVRKLLAALKQEGLDGIIIDLRGNGGGSLDEALEFTGLFIEAGPVVQTRDAQGSIKINRDPDPGLAYAGPLAVLVDRNSASAAEIFAGAIQDYRRGIIIGEPTFGKGTVQSVIDLNRFARNSADKLGRLKTTIAQFFRISGGSNQHKGVIPDIVFPTAQFITEHGERSLDNALPWTAVRPAKYIPARAPIGRFDHARRLHHTRLETDKLFPLILEELALGRQAREKKSITLLEEKRQVEREKLRANKKRISDEFRSAQGLPPRPDEEDADTANDEDQPPDDEEDQLDVLLEESAQILLDLITPEQKTAAKI